MLAYLNLPTSDAHTRMTGEQWNKTADVRLTRRLGAGGRVVWGVGMLHGPPTFETPVPQHPFPLLSLRILLSV